MIISIIIAIIISFYWLPDPPPEPVFYGPKVQENAHSPKNVFFLGVKHNHDFCKSCLNQFLGRSR